MNTIIVGRVRPVEKGEYDNTAEYTYMDRVTYNGTAYECVNNSVTGIAPQANDFTYWVPLAQKGEKGDTGDKGTDGVNGEQGDAGDTGPDGDTGPIPQHTWVDGKKLSFEYPDGTYDAGVDLTGDPGDKGETGPAYSLPLSNSVTSTSTDTAASAYAANIAYSAAAAVADRTISDSIDLDSSTTYASSKAVYSLHQAAKSNASAPIGLIAYYTGAYWEAEDKSYACPYVQINGVWTIEEDWVFCTGITKNGITVPDLSGLFILSASSAYPAGTLYNNATTHTHSGSVCAFTLNNSTLPKHTHSASVINSWTSYGDSCTDTEVSNGSIYYNFSGSTVTTSNVGSSKSHNHAYTLASADKLPPYYQVSFIMKIA